jgi:hypothetical protein
VVSQQSAYVIEVTARQPADSTAWLAQLAAQRIDLTQIVEGERQNEWLLALREVAEIVDERAEFFAAQANPPTALPPMF